LLLDGLDGHLDGGGTALARLPRMRRSALSWLHRVSSRGDRRWTLVLLSVVVLPRIVSLSVGCGPRAGDEGGPCIESNNCNRDDYCNGSLVCSGSTCVAPTPQPFTPLPIDPCTTLLSRAPCSAGFETRCIHGAIPDPAWNGACTAAVSDSQGNTVFCCDTSKPMCWAPWGEATLTATPSYTNETYSDCPGALFSCHDLAAPIIPDASIQCASDLPNDAGWVLVCCVAGNACFENPSSSGNSANGYYPQGACTAGEHEFFCTGSATLTGAPCRALGVIDAGAMQAPAFCCPSDSIPSVSYGDGGAQDASIE
jgi:hypothetical protein